MRKTLLVIVASGALIAAMPATALAKHHSRHHHARIHHRRIGDPASPTTPGGVGTVTAFDSTTGMLTITPTATGASPMTGMVTSETDVDCIAPEPTGTTSPGDDDNGDQGGTFSGGGGSGDEGDQGDDDQSDQNQACTITVGATVLAADLSLSSAGQNFDKVVLMATPSSTPPMVPDTDNDGD